MNHPRVRPPSHHLSATYRFATFGDANEWADQVKKEISGDAVVVEVRLNEVTLVYSDRVSSTPALNGSAAPPLAEQE